MIRSTVEAVAEGAPDGISGIAKSVSKNAGGGLLGGVLGGAAGGAMFGPLGMLAGAAGGAMFGSGGLTDSIKAMVGEDGGVGAASAVMPTTDIHDRVKRDITTAKASTSVGGKDLSSISSATDQQCKTLMEIRDHLAAIRGEGEKTDTSSGYAVGEMGSTESQIMPKGSPQYAKWQFGRHEQIGGKQIINDGQ